LQKRGGAISEVGFCNLITKISVIGREREDIF